MSKAGSDAFWSEGDPPDEGLAPAANVPPLE